MVLPEGWSQVRLFIKKIDPRCAYCSHSVELGGEKAACLKRGVVMTYSNCRAFKYDPLKRTPPKPAKLRRNYSDADFKL